MRTFFDVELILETPRSYHNHRFYAILPFDFKKPDFTNSLPPKKRALHLIRRAIAWQNILTERSLVTPVQIAEHEEIN